MADRIQQRRDTAARWAQFNPILLEGEVGYVTDDPNQYKIGDGVHTWNELPLRGFDGTLVHTTGDSTTSVMSQKIVSNLLRGEAASISDNIRSPYTFIGNFATWAEVQTELDKLHNSDGGADNKVIGEFRVQLDGRNLLVRSWVQNWATGVFTQTVQGSIQWNAETQTMDQSLNINTYERRYNEGTGWTMWEESSNSLINSEGKEEYDLAIMDEKGNILCIFDNGHIRTKNFNSKEINTAPSENPLKGKIISILGDSISTFGTPDQSNAEGTWTYAGNRCRYPQSGLLTNVNDTYWKKLIDNNGMVFGINESWAGSTISNTQVSDSGDAGPNRHIASLTRIKHLGEKGTPDYILVYGGTNDIAKNVTLGTFSTESPKDYTEDEIESLSVETFADAVRAMIIRLMYYYKNSKILICFPNFTKTYYPIDRLDNYVEILREACDFFGIPYIDLRTSGVTIFNESSYLPDGIHPNAAGMQLIYSIIDNKIKSI